MTKQTPRLEIFLGRIRENAHSVISLCRKYNVKVAGVTKVVAGNPLVAQVLIEAGVEMLADSRIVNLAKLRNAGFNLPLMLLRTPALSEIDKVIAFADISLNSSLESIMAISEAASKIGKKHGIIIMVDLGDLREGIWPDLVTKVVADVTQLSGIEILGLGCNFACFRGVIPTLAHMEMLIAIRNECRRLTGLELPLISGGNSSGLPLLASGNLPKEINHYRIGEAIILGRNPIDKSAWSDTRQDTVVLTVEVIEVGVKQAFEINATNYHLQAQSNNNPPRSRAVCNIGRVDVDPSEITPLEPGIKILGASSDHLILDIEDADFSIKVGTELHFVPYYNALLRLMTSPYVEKIIIK